MRAEVLVVAGEASGDLAAARVVRALPAGTRTFGMGGEALRDAGCELVADLRDVTAMGLGGVARRGLHVARAMCALRRAASRRQPSAALLVNYTEFNLRLARAVDAPAVLYGAPQIWAWRPARAASIAQAVSRIAVMFPFEEPLWREAGARVTYVGHPATEAHVRPRDDARRALGLTERAEAIAILPGSRPHEVRRLLGEMLTAFARLRRDRGAIDARVLLAPSLDRTTRRRAEAAAREAGVSTVAVDARDGLAAHLAAFDAALVASGTASLECALCGVPPVVAYRVDRLTALAARALLQTPHVALPNVLLGRRAFAELLQGEATAQRMAREIARVLDAPEAAQRDAASVREMLTLSGPSPSRRVAALLEALSRAPAPSAEPHAVAV